MASGDDPGLAQRGDLLVGASQLREHLVGVLSVHGGVIPHLLRRPGEACRRPAIAVTPQGRVLALHDQVVVDDLGWNNVGWHNKEMQTPNADALAKDGIILDKS